MASIKFGKLKIEDAMKIALYTDGGNLFISYTMSNHYQNSAMVKIPKLLKIEIQSPRIDRIACSGDVMFEGYTRWLSSGNIVTIDGWLPFRGGNEKNFRVYEYEKLSDLPKLAEPRGIRSTIMHIDGNLDTMNFHKLSIPVFTKIQCPRINMLSSEGKIAVKGNVDEITECFGVYVRPNRG